MKRQLKFALIKEGIAFEEIFIDEDVKKGIKNNGNYKYYHFGFTFPIKNVFIDNIIGEKNRKNQGFKEVMILCHPFKLKNKNRNLLVISGDPRSLIDIWKLEENFGIKLGINFHLSNNNKLAIKDINYKNGANGNNYRENKTISSTIGGFNFNQLTDFLKELKLSTKLFDNKKTTIKLNNYIQIPYDENKDINKIIDSIKDIIQKNYGLKKYKKDFEYIDNFFPINKDEEKKIIEKLWQKIENGDISDFAISLPNFEDESHSYYKVGNSNNQLHNLDLIEIVKEAKQERKILRNVLLNSLDDNGSLITFHKLEKCIFGQIDYQKSSYIINEGRALKIQKDFLKEIEEKYSKVRKSQIKFFDWFEKEKEKDYNEKSCNRDGWYNLDTRILKFDQNQKLEIADLLITKKKMKSLIAVKMARNASSISHLISQVKNAISLIMLKKETVEKHILKETNEDINLDDYKKFVIAIATKKSNEYNLPKLPLFAKLLIVQLSRAYLGKEIEFAWIKIKS